MNELPYNENSTNEYESIPFSSIVPKEHEMYNLFEDGYFIDYAQILRITIGNILKCEDTYADLYRDFYDQYNPLSLSEIHNKIEDLFERIRIYNLMNKCVNGHEKCIKSEQLTNVSPEDMLNIEKMKSSCYLEYIEIRKDFKKLIESNIRSYPNILTQFERFLVVSDFDGLFNSIEQNYIQIKTGVIRNVVESVLEYNSVEFNLEHFIKEVPHVFSSTSSHDIYFLNSLLSE